MTAKGTVGAPTCWFKRQFGELLGDKKGKGRAKFFIFKSAWRDTLKPSRLSW
jgi:hypothetical protein